MLRRPHVNPVAMKLKPNLLLTLRNNKRFQRIWDRKVQSIINFLHWLFQLNRSLCTSSTINFRTNNLVHTNLILKCCTYTIGCHIKNPIPCPNNSTTITLRQKISVRSETRIK